MTATSIAMETDKIENPKAIAFINNDTVVVGGQNGCSTFNSHSQQLIKKLTPSNIYNLVVNKDVIAVIAKNETKKNSKPKLTVFDTTTSTKTRSS